MSFNREFPHFDVPMTNRAVFNFSTQWLFLGLLRPSAKVVSLFLRDWNRLEAIVSGDPTNLLVPQRVTMTVNPVEYLKRILPPGNHIVTLKLREDSRLDVTFEGNDAPDQQGGELPVMNMMISVTALGQGSSWIEHADTSGRFLVGLESDMQSGGGAV